MGLLPVAPTGHILHQLAQGLAGGRIAQGSGFLRGRNQLRRRQLGGFQGQAPQQDRNPVEDRGQAEVRVAGGVADPADHREGGTGDGD